MWQYTSVIRLWQLSNMDDSPNTFFPGQLVAEVDTPSRPVQPVNESERAPEVEQVALIASAVIAIAVMARPGLGLATTLSVVVVAASIAVRRTRSVMIWCALSLTLVPWLVVRDNAWLAISILFTVALMVGLSLIAGASASSIWDLSLRSIFTRGPARRTQRTSITTSAASRVTLGLIVATPIVGGFYLLLASADAVFASIFDLSALPVARFVIFVAAAVAATVLLRFGADGRKGVKPLAKQRFGSLEATVVLGAVSVLFTAFIAVRFATIGRPLDDLGLRSEVRSGFFQLLWVAALTVVLILAIREVCAEAMTRMVQNLGLLTIALASVIDALALYRIWQYVDQSFLTQLRVWSFGFGLWLLIVLALTAIRLGGFRSTSNWFTGALVMSWMVFVLAMAATNPDVRIVEYNFANPPTGADEWISVIPLIEISEDATPLIVENIDVLRPLPNNRFQRVVDHLCATGADTDVRNFNFGRRSATAATQTLCGPN